MTLVSSRLAPLGAALVVAGLVTGVATAQGQLAGDTRLTGATPTVLTTPLPKLESILAQGLGESCDPTDGTVFVAGGTGYQKSGETLGTADVFGGATGLRLVGSRMADVNGVVVILSDGRRINPRTFLKSCTDSQNRPAIRVTFDLPQVTTATTVRLQLTAPEPQPLIAPPPTPPQLCRDPLTGVSKPCQTLPPLPPKSIKVADLGLVLHPRPSITVATPDRVDAGSGTRTCRARIRFSGQNLANADISAGSAALTNFTRTIVSRSSSAIVADVTKDCPGGAGYVFTMVSTTLNLRRGPVGASTAITQCDTCTSARSLGTVAIGFR
jgi:hypothetical protein